jgi:GTP-binding protein
VHCISLTSDDCVRDYKTIRNELNQYDPALIEKPELVVLTKKDTVSAEGLNAAQQQLAQYNSDILAVSVDDEFSLKQLNDTLIARLRG